VRGINRPTDLKFGPDGSAYLVAARPLVAGGPAEAKSAACVSARDARLAPDAAADRPAPR